jgi:hypothetical protein
MHYAIIIIAINGMTFTIKLQEFSRNCKLKEKELFIH